MSVPRSESANTEQRRRTSEVMITRESTEDRDDVQGADNGDVNMEDLLMEAGQVVDLTHSAEDWKEITIYLDFEISWRRCASLCG